MRSVPSTESFVVLAVLLPLLLGVLQSALRTLLAVLGELLDRRAAEPAQRGSVYLHVTEEARRLEENGHAALRAAGVALLVGEASVLAVLLFEPAGWPRVVAALLCTSIVLLYCLGLVLVPGRLHDARQARRADARQVRADAGTV